MPLSVPIALTNEVLPALTPPPPLPLTAPNPIQGGFCLLTGEVVFLRKAVGHGERPRQLTVPRRDSEAGAPYKSDNRATSRVRKLGSRLCRAGQYDRVRAA